VLCQCCVRLGLWRVSYENVGVPSLRDSIHPIRLPGTAVPGFHMPSLRDWIGTEIREKRGWQRHDCCGLYEASF